MSRIGSGRSRAKLAVIKAELFEEQHGLCYYCRRPMSLHPEPWGIGESTPPDFATIEHRTRRADGGSNDRGNLAVACFECNVTRGEMSVDEFMALKQSPSPVDPVRIAELDQRMAIAETPLIP